MPYCSLNLKERQKSMVQKLFLSVPQRDMPSSSISAADILPQNIKYGRTALPA